MCKFKTLAITAFFAFSGAFATAEEASVPPPERSVSSEYILLGILSALMIWAAVDAQD